MGKKDLALRQECYCSLCGKLLSVRAFPSDGPFDTNSFFNRRSGCCSAYLSDVFLIVEEEGALGTKPSDLIKRAVTFDVKEAKWKEVDHTAPAAEPAKPAAEKSSTKMMLTLVKNSDDGHIKIMGVDFKEVRDKHRWLYWKDALEWCDANGYDVSDRNAIEEATKRE